jgi:hypothetical protein
MKDDILYELIHRLDGSLLEVPWLPSSLVTEILYLYHDHPISGHFGINRMFHKLREQFFFPRMYDQVKKYIRSCTMCSQFNVQRQKKPGYLQVEAIPEGVFEIMQMDFWKAPVKSISGNQYVLIITDRLSKYVCARAVHSATGSVAAEMLLEDIILKHGAIKCLQSDQGSHFRNELLSTLTQLIGCEQKFSIPYHPMSNGQVERFNSTFCDQLKKYCHTTLDDWDTYLSSIIWAYNSTYHTTTQCIPYELAFARRPCCPFVSSSKSINLPKSQHYLEKALRFRYLLSKYTRANIDSQRLMTKLRYDKGRQHPNYKAGDLVWIRSQANRSKFDAKYHGPFLIIDCLSPVKYLVEHATDGYQQYEHLNNLIPFYERNN